MYRKSVDQLMIVLDRFYSIPTATFKTYFVSDHRKQTSKNRKWISWNRWKIRCFSRKEAVPPAPTEGSMRSRPEPERYILKNIIFWLQSLHWCPVGLFIWSVNSKQYLDRLQKRTNLVSVGIWQISLIMVYYFLKLLKGVLIHAEKELISNPGTKGGGRKSKAQEKQ